jgi:heme-degrading monooxygenase HmoA
MFNFQQLDASTPFQEQLQETTGPIVLINTFVLDTEGTVEQVMAAWQNDAGFMKAQPGFISAQLHRGVGSSRLVTNVSVWESTEALRNAVLSPEFREKAQGYPPGIKVYPQIVQKVAIDGVCVA